MSERLVTYLDFFHYVFLLHSPDGTLRALVQIARTVAPIDLKRRGEGLGRPVQHGDTGLDVLLNSPQTP